MVRVLWGTNRDRPKPTVQYTLTIRTETSRPPYKLLYMSNVPAVTVVRPVKKPVANGFHYEICVLIKMSEWYDYNVNNEINRTTKKPPIK